MQRWAKNSVLVATDLSEGADEAVRQADAWARRAGLPLLVVHAAPDPLQLVPLLPRESVGSIDWASVRRRAADAVRRRVESLTKREPAEFEVVVEPGKAHSVTIDVAQCSEASLVVVGTTNKGPVNRLLLGTTGEQLVRHAHASVLVARRSPSSGVVVAATDLSERAMAPMHAAAQEARRRSARVIALHCIETPHPALSAFEPALVLDSTTLAAMRSACGEVLKAQLASAEAGGRPLIVEGKTARAIVQVARDENAELVVVGTHGRSGLARVALGSVAEAVARRAPCSVLIVRNAS